jgi:ATP-dependent RNA helicase DeaD
MFAPDRTHPALLAALTARGYASPTPVQKLVGEASADADLLVSAATGSGKTVAFGLAMAHAVLRGEQRIATSPSPRALVVAPTRELALQVARELSWLFAQATTRPERFVATCVGGTDPRAEARALEQGPTIVVGTPGRLCDHMRRGRLDFSGLAVAVLDEADEMLDMGFRDEIEEILKHLPAERRTLLFSATMPREIERLAATYQRQAERIKANTDASPHADIDCAALLVSTSEGEHAVVNVLRQLDPAAAIVFCATRDGTTHMLSGLRERGFSAVALSGELSQAERNRALQALRDGAARVLVATDVAARGLDLPSVALVVHADLPNDKEVLQHRNGRTGRAGRKGTAVVLVPAPRRKRAEYLFRDAGLPLRWMDVPTAEQIVEADGTRIIEQIGALAAEVTDDDLALARRAVTTVTAAPGDEAGSAESAESSALRLVAALTRQLRERLPVPEELSETIRLNERRQNPPRPARGEGGPGRDAGHEHLRPRHGQEPPEGRHGGRGHESVWFRVNVGRQHNADPRWLIPMICRRGNIEKADIGSIRILQFETRFEIGLWAVDHFVRNVRRPDRKEPHVRFAPVD